MVREGPLTVLQAEVKQFWRETALARPKNNSRGKVGVTHKERNCSLVSVEGSTPKVASCGVEQVFLPGSAVVGTEERKVFTVSVV